MKTEIKSGTPNTGEGQLVGGGRQRHDTTHDTGGVATQNTQAMTDIGSEDIVKVQQASRHAHMARRARHGWADR
jgi:hypothetical protein